MKRTFVALALVVSNEIVGAQTSPYQQFLALEESIAGKTTLCGIELVDAKKEAGAQSVLLFKAALRAYRFTDGDAFEFYVDAGFLDPRQAEPSPRRVPVETAWIRTQSNREYRLTRERNAKMPTSAAKIGIGQDEYDLLREVSKGSAVRLGFNLTPGAYDQVFEFTGLDQKEARRLQRCLLTLIVR